MKNPLCWLHKRIRWKLIAVYVFIGMLPFTFFIVKSYKNTQSLALQNQSAELNNALEQAVRSVDDTLENYNVMSGYLLNEQNLLGTLNRSYGSSYYDMYETYRKTITPMIETYYSLYLDLERITFYTACDIYPYMDYVSPLAELEQDEPWFADHPVTYAAQWVAPQYTSDGSLVCARRIGLSTRFPYINCLYMSLDPDMVFRPLHSISTHPYVILIRLGNDSFFLHDTLSTQNDPLDPETVLDDDHTQLNIVHARLDSTGWDVYYICNISDILSSVNQATLSAYIGSLLVLLLFGFATIITISSLTRPIEGLAESMIAFGHGDMNITVPVNRTDEVGQLQRSFNDMVFRIRELIEVTYNNEIREREYQQRLLQAQINPHFLYNSLSIINSKAIMAEQPEISSMAMQLSKFYRSALNHGRSVTTIRSEMDNINAYVNLQLMLCSNYFHPIYDVDESLLDVLIPNFILQPIVENAIDHGLRNNLRQDKTLTIRIHRDGDDVVFIVHDNGAGMDDETLRSLYQEKTEGYGVRNVADRLQLTYAGQYTMSIESVLGESTTVTLRLPIGFLKDE